jgi:lipoprotein-releasing system permease protein
LNFPFFIAKRYLFSKKSRNVINVITIVAGSGVAIGTMALIVVLSAFNGIENLVLSLMNAFNPDIRITAEVGKSFNSEDPGFEQVKKLSGVAYYTEVIEENALLKYRDKQFIGTIKGVSNDFVKMSRMDTTLVDGSFVLEEDGVNYTVIGRGVASQLDIGIGGFLMPLHIYVPGRTTGAVVSPESAFKIGLAYPSGIFSIQLEFDNKYIIIPIELARELLQYENRISAIEIAVQPGVNVGRIENQIKEILGPGYAVKDRYRQNDMLYKILRSEKFAVYLILTFILIIATFNVIGSITMMVIEKKNDIRILSNIGADGGLIRKIFFTEGILISFIGAVSGLTLGFILCLLQQRFDLIKLDGSFVMESYPVEMHVSDFLLVFFTVMIIGALASVIPAARLRKKEIPSEE